MNRIAASRFALLAAGALLLASCGLKDDLYLPTEESPGAPPDAPTSDDAVADEEEATGESS